MKNILKKVIPNKLIEKRSKYLEYSNGYKETKHLYANSDNKQFIYLVGTPDHDNLGDHAIAYSELEFLGEYCKEFEVIEIHTVDINKHSKALKKNIKKNDFFVFHGGGNIGNEYLNEEEARREIISNFPKNKIIIFPQTIYFSDDKNGKDEFEITKKIYSRHNNLYLIAREVKSYEIMKQAFSMNKVMLTPDIVTYLNKTDEKINRKGALLCIRNDKESKLTADKKNKIQEVVHGYYEDILITDTSLDKMVSKENRNKELYEKWSQFQKAELVITDRLHGMVFAAITSTPCIAIGNYNYKVKGTFEWLKHLNYIRFVDSIDDIKKNIEELKSIENEPYNNEFTKESFQKIIDISTLTEA